jgi:hypothetical protein
MLNNPKWDTFTSNETPLLEELIAWLEKQDPSVLYSPCVPATCLLGKFGWIIEAVPEPFRDVAYDRPHTFGAALHRARQALK